MNVTGASRRWVFWASRPEPAGRRVAGATPATPAAVTAMLLITLSAFAGEGFLTGPGTGKRFPPLKVPAGFKATLFACDPLIEYLSVIAMGPRPGTVFVAHDYMTGLGIEIVRRDEIRVVEDTDGDGYADKSTVFAKGFNSIQGLAFDNGAVYVMHAPHLTVLRDLDGDGVADERRDLLSGIGLPPEENPQRLHCANGVVPAHDGWLYLAIGDHGCDVSRPEGDRLVLHGGGILRCRPDGRDLHVFASGLRNIYDVALDDELNVFVRDNENDGGSYKIRVCHSFFGADHGYPYKYLEHPAEALPPLADLGLGSSAGGVCYLEQGFPEEYRGNLFFCEWSHAVVRYARIPNGSGFAPMKEIEFAAGAPNDPYGFKPTDVIVDRDGSLLVSDWGDGQRPLRGRGRIYRISYESQSLPPTEKSPSSLDDWIAQLDAPSHCRRVEAQAAIERRGATGLEKLRRALRNGKIGPLGRMHAVWIFAHESGPDWRELTLRTLLEFADRDPDYRVRAQAVRAVADLADPVLDQHKLNTGSGDMAAAAALAGLASKVEEAQLREIVIALGRLRWRETPSWLRFNLKNPDAPLAHAAMQALRRCNSWPAVLSLLDEPDSNPLRGIALRATTEQADPAIVAGLGERLRRDPDARHRMEYAEMLVRIHRLPGPWVYWGYRPGPRPANMVPWDETGAIEETLDRALADTDREVRTATLRRMQAEQVPPRLVTLERWLRTERDRDSVASILDSLRDRPAEAVRDLLIFVVLGMNQDAGNRLAALDLLVRGLGPADQGKLLEAAAALEDGPVLAESLRQLGLRRDVPSRPLLRAKLDSPSPDVRAAALESIAALQDHDASDQVLRLLQDAAAPVRRAAATAAGRLQISQAVDPLLKLAIDPDPQVRRESLEALRRLRAPQVLPLALAGLRDGATQPVALECLADFGGPEHLEAVTGILAKNPPSDILRGAVRALTAWQQKEPAGSPNHNRLEKTMAGVQGGSGLLLRWNVTLTKPDSAAQMVTMLSHRGQSPDDLMKASPAWHTSFASGADARVELGPPPEGDKNSVWLAFAVVSLPEPAEVQFLGSATGNLGVWLNGVSIHQREKPGAFQPDSDRFGARLERGENLVAVQVPAGVDARFHLRFRRRNSNASHERLTQLALTRPGEAARGREVFLNAEKSLCLKCHRLGDQGARVGPELTGAGSRFSRIYLVESILQPSRTIAPEFEYLMVELKDGPPLLGVKTSETRETVVFGDLQGLHEIPKANIAKQQPLPVSLMPEGLEKNLTEKEFVDLVAFLLEQK